MKSQVEESKRVKAEIDKLINDFDCIEIKHCEDCHLFNYCDAYGLPEDYTLSQYKRLTWNI